MFSQKASTNGLKNSVECHGKGRRKGESGTALHLGSAGQLAVSVLTKMCMCVCR